MSSRNLSADQFGQSNPAAAGPPPLVEHPTFDLPQHPSLPLPGSALTYTTAQRAAAWRKPTQAMPGSQQTFGTVFQPFAE